MKKYLAFALLLAVVVSACSSGGTEEKKTGPDTEPEVKTKASPEEEVTDGTEPNIGPEVDSKVSKDAKASRVEIEAKDAASISIARITSTGLGPTDTLRAFNDAVIKKDAPKIKSLLSRKSLDIVTKLAAQNGVTVDQQLTGDGGGPMPIEREMRNEDIEGDVATVEIKNSVLGSWDKMFLVKENGGWRLALDKFQEEMQRRINEAQKDAPVTK